MKEITVFKPKLVSASIIYPETEKKLALTIEGKKTTYSFFLTNEDARHLQATLKHILGDNPYEPSKFRERRYGF